MPTEKSSALPPMHTKTRVLSTQSWMETSPLPLGQAPFAQNLSANSSLFHTLQDDLSHSEGGLILQLLCNTSHTLYWEEWKRALQKLPLSVRSSQGDHRGTGSWNNEDDVDHQLSLPEEQYSLSAIKVD